MRIANLLSDNIGLPVQITLGDAPAFNGGEGDIYFTQDGLYAVKVYHDAVPEKVQLLETITRLGAHLDDAARFLAWPLGIVTEIDGQPATGVVTRAVQPPGDIPLCKLMVNPKAASEVFARGHGWQTFLKIARSTAAAVRTIHQLGMAHGDIHHLNVLASVVSGEAVLIDLDGLIVKGFLPPQVIGMRGFIAPEVLQGHAHPDKYSDRHSLAVLMLWILLLRNVMRPLQCYDDTDDDADEYLGFGEHACYSEHPTDRRNWCAAIGMPLLAGGWLSQRMLTPKLQVLASKALIDGLRNPLLRPDAGDWERALAEAEDSITACTSCGQSLLYPHWVHPATSRMCPFCGSVLDGIRPALIELLDPRMRGVYVPARPVLLHDRTRLYEDHVDSDRPRSFSRIAVPSVGEAHWDKKLKAYRLVNRDSIPWLVVGEADQVSPGASVILTPGRLISFGAGKRVARVIE